MSMLTSADGVQTMHKADLQSVAQHLARRGHEGVWRLDGLSLSNFVWAMAKFKYQDRQFLHQTQKRACQLAASHRLAAPYLARILWAFAELKWKPTSCVRYSLPNLLPSMFTSCLSLQSC